MVFVTLPIAVAEQARRMRVDQEAHVRSERRPLAPCRGSSRTRSPSAFLLAVALCSTQAAAQGLNWSTDFVSTITNNDVMALQSFDDGSGPALFVGGFFGIAKWTNAGWQSAGWLNGDTVGFGIFDSGGGSRLYAGGDFSSAVAKWDGTAWTVVGNGLTPASSGGPVVRALAAYDDGAGSGLFVGGAFDGAPGVNSKAIIKWSGSSWFPVGGGLGGGAGGPAVWTLAVYDDGAGPALYAGGNFTLAGGAPANYIARWNGASWSSLGSGANNVVTSLAVYDDGSGPALFVGGAMTAAGGVPVSFLAKWNGSGWSAVPGAFSSNVDALMVFDDGNGLGLYVGGHFGSVNGLPARRIIRWDGTTWSTLGNGTNTGAVKCMAVHDDGTGGSPDLYLGGSFYEVGGALASNRIAKWSGCAGPIDAMCFGDRTVAPCPCSNYGLTGHGCENSAGTGGARLYAQGTTSPDALVLTSAGELPSALSIFLQGSALNPTTDAFGDGLRCVGGNLKRLYVKSAANGTAQAPQAGDPSVSAQSANLGDPLAPGMVRYYQAYYRDPDGSFCQPPQGSTFNASNGLRVVW